jgi:hypothetical protein
MIAAFPLTRIELSARHFKDLLADTHLLGTLSHLGRTRNTVGVGLYVAFADRLTRKLFPELMPAADEVLRTGDWAVIARPVTAGHSAAERYAATILGAYGNAKSRHDLARLPADIERLLGRYLDGES